MDSVRLSKVINKTQSLLLRSYLNNAIKYYLNYIEKGLFFSSLILLVALLFSYFLAFTVSFSYFFIASIPLLASVLIAVLRYKGDYYQCAKELDNQYATQSLFQTALSLTANQKVANSIRQKILHDAEKQAERIKLPGMTSGLEMNLWLNSTIYVIVLSALLYYFAPKANTANEELFSNDTESLMLKKNEQVQELRNETMPSATEDKNNKVASDNSSAEKSQSTPKQIKQDAKLLFDELNDESISLPAIAEQKPDRLLTMDQHLNKRGEPASDVSLAKNAQTANQQQADLKNDTEHPYLSPENTIDLRKPVVDQVISVLKPGAETHVRDEVGQFAEQNSAEVNALAKNEKSHGATRAIITLPENISPQTKIYLSTFYNNSGIEK